MSEIRDSQWYADHMLAIADPAMPALFRRYHDAWKKDGQTGIARVGAEVQEEVRKEREAKKTSPVV
jgi:hypothetical protein